MALCSSPVYTWTLLLFYSASQFRSCTCLAEALQIGCQTLARCHNTMQIFQLPVEQCSAKQQQQQQQQQQQRPSPVKYPPDRSISCGSSQHFRTESIEQLPESRWRHGRHGRAQSSRKYDIGCWCTSRGSCASLKVYDIVCLFAWLDSRLCLFRSSEDLIAGFTLCQAAQGPWNFRNAFPATFLSPPS